MHIFATQKMAFQGSRSRVASDYHRCFARTEPPFLEQYAPERPEQKPHQNLVQSDHLIYHASHILHLVLCLWQRIQYLHLI